jgi:hypothetical protein
MAIIAHFIDKDWKLCEELIGFESLKNIHSGFELAKVVNGIITKFSLQDRVISVTTDNASNNSTLLLELNSFLESAVEQKLIAFGNKVEHIPCHWVPSLRCAA